MRTVLVIEDDLNICEVLTYYLRKSGNYTVSIVHSSEEGIVLIRNGGRYDIILCDIMLPGMDGIEFCREVRKLIFCPIIFISCLDDDETIVKALSMGGDDYLVKPFHGPVLLAHIEATLRRCGRQETTELLAFGELELDGKRRLVKKGGRELSLSPTEYDLLWYLARSAGRFVSYQELYEGVWKKPSLGDYRSLFVHISNLRKKIEEAPARPKLLRTHPGGGYLFGPEA